MRTILRMLRAVIRTRPVLVRDAVYSKQQLDEIFGDNPRRWQRWKSAGLRPLETWTNAEYFLSNDLLELFVKLRTEGRT